MPTGVPTNPIIKAEILDEVKNQGIAVSQISKQYGIRSNIIYAWMRNESVTSHAR